MFILYVYKAIQNSISFILRRRIPWKYLLKDQTVNKFPSAFFTTKTGLLTSLQQLHWYSPQPVSSFFPRCYQVNFDYRINDALK